jgi:nucleotide-binding universal stress UspA family protein
MQCKVVLLHVVETHPYYSVPYYLAGGADSALEKDIEKIAEGWLIKTEEIAKKQNVEVKHEILFRSKSVVQSIVSYAKGNEADLIVMGSRGLTGFKGLLLGSVALGVIDHATCPVLLVR